MPKQLDKLTNTSLPKLEASEKLSDKADSNSTEVSSTKRDAPFWIERLGASTKRLKSWMSKSKDYEARYLKNTRVGVYYGFNEHNKHNVGLKLSISL